MIVWFSTVLRSAPPQRGGELVKLDWDAKQVLARTPIVPTEPTLDDPNPRGNTRGGRGIVPRAGGGVVVASYHSLLFFDADLNLERTVSHPLMASLHEHVSAPGDTLWTTSTAIDAALHIDLASGQLLRAVHPREQAGFQRALGVQPLAFDRHADNRARFLGSEHYRHPHHLHLNAVALFEGELLGLFSKPGVIANLDREQVLIADKGLKGSHNLLVSADGRALVAHSVHRGVLSYDLGSGARGRRLRFDAAAPVRKIARRHDALYALRRRLAAWKLWPHTPPRPLFVRGLTRHRGHLFVGISPATILRIDEASGEVVDHFAYARDVNACVHGLLVDDRDGASRNLR